MAIKVKFPKLSKLLNTSFIPLFLNQDRYLVLWGGRGSSKSTFTAQKLIYRCLVDPYFRFLLIRKVAENVKDSQWQTIKDEVYRMGLQSLFTFTTSPLEINCTNGNKFLCRGLDKPEKIKSVKDPSGAWYEEGNQMTEEDFITVTTSIRSSQAPYLQEIFSFNPEYDGADYTDFWIHKYFFGSRPETERSFRDKVKLTLPNGDKLEYNYTVHHSTYEDNRFIGPEAIATYEALKATNYYYYQVFCLGIWGRKVTGGEFYKCFDQSKHIGATTYAPADALHISFDENVNPYITLTIYQIKGNHVKQIDEICLETPRNTLRDLCNEFQRKYQSHTAGLFVYGDATSRKADVKLEKGYDFYKLIRNYLESYKPLFRVPKSNPAVVMRGNFINTALEGFEGIKITIGDNCKNSIADFTNVKEAPDGTKAKLKVRDSETKVSYEQFGHCSDTFDYLLCEAFKNLFTLYQNGRQSFDRKIVPRNNARY